MKKAARKLIGWYRSHRIVYPWRRTADPYRIWVSEILLQQTRIPVALPFYERIVKRFPSFQDLAAADPDDFLAAWSGIGYYRRAENMIACARQVVQEHGGSFPSDPAALLKLPGIGSYTAGAIRNLCFGQLTPAIDGNIGRVLARLIACRASMSGREFARQIGEAFMEYGAGTEPGEYFQSLMELGERVCLPQPDCSSCPLRSECSACKGGLTNRIPARSPRKKPQAMYWHFLLIRRGHAYYLVRNPHRSFLKSAWLFPDLLSGHPLSMTEIQHGFRNQWNIHVQNLEELGVIRHSVTFRKITGRVLTASHYGLPSGDGLWLTRKELDARHTSSVVHKILATLLPARE